MTFEGPTPELWDRYSRATNAPVIMGLGLGGVAALNQRVIDARTFEAMSAEDQQLIRQAEYEISAGLSPTLQNPADWTVGSDWAAEEAEMGLEAGDPVDGESKALPADLPGMDDDDWVGM